MVHPLPIKLDDEHHLNLINNFRENQDHQFEQGEHHKTGQPDKIDYSWENIYNNCVFMLKSTMQLNLICYLLNFKSMFNLIIKNKNC